MERGEAVSGSEEQQSDRVGADRSAGDSLPQQRPEPTHSVHGHQRGLPRAHPGCAEAGRATPASHMVRAAFM